jgi:hypothetical protein
VNVHASRSSDTFADEIVESGAFLVLAISAFGNGHDPSGTVAPGNAVVLGAGLLAPDAAGTTATKTSEITWAKSLAPRYRRQASFARIWFTASLRFVSLESLRLSTGTSCECRRHSQFELIVENPDCRRAGQIVPLGTGKQT